jgi:hypothetical protein
VRSFAGGAWTTRGNGTVGGRSSASPTFAGSLNFDNNNVFASRFDNTGDANQGKWIFAGQSRGNGGSGPDVPPLNVHTNEDAENPSVAGGSTADPTRPGPWITWQETSNSGGQDQIFVDKPEGPGMANCNGVTPAGVADGSGNVPAIGGFCFHDVGVERAGQGSLDPSLNVDVNRNGIEPDIAFTGANDSVPWVVWYAAVQTLAPANAPTPFTAQLTVLPAGTTIHYRAVAMSDFGTFVGADQSLTMSPTPPPAGTVTLTSGNARTVRIALNGQGRKLLASRHVLSVKLVVTEALGNGRSATVSAQTVTFKTHSGRHGRH